MIRKSIAILVLPALLFFPLMGIAAAPRQVTVTTTNDSVSLVTAIEAAASDYIKSTSVTGWFVKCETNDARIAFGGSATTGAILAVGESLGFTGNTELINAYVCSKTAGQAATLRVTILY